MWSALVSGQGLMPCDLSTVCIVHTLAQREELNVAVNSKARDAYNHREAKDVKAPLKTLGVDHRADQRDDEGEDEEGGGDGEDAQPFTYRYIGALVGDFHRTLLYGGIWLYPPDNTAPEVGGGRCRLWTLV